MKKAMFECGSCRTMFGEEDARRGEGGPECPFCGSARLNRTPARSSFLRWLLRVTSGPAAGGCSRGGYS